MIDLVVKALAYSSCIGLGAASVSIIYTTARTWNFVLASMLAWGFYIVFSFSSIYGGTPYLYIPVATLFSGLLGLITYFTVNRRLLKTKANEATLMMSTLGVDLILYGFLNVFSDYLLNVYKIPSKYFVLETKDVVLSLGGLQIRTIGIVAPIILVISVIVLNRFLTKTKLGIAMRATIENPELAGALGINSEVVYALAWFIGGMLAGLSGGLLSLIISGYTSVGMFIMVTFFAGAIVGGIYSIYGSLLGGLLVGLGEYVGVYLMSVYVGGWISAYRPVFPMAVLATALLILPEGLVSIQWGKLLKLRGVRK